MGNEWHKKCFLDTTQLSRQSCADQLYSGLLDKVVETTDKVQISGYLMFFLFMVTVCHTTITTAEGKQFVLQSFQIPYL